VSDPTDLLGLSAKRGRVHALAAARVLDAAELDRALIELELRPTGPSWSKYLYWHALIIGVVLLVAGTIFFVAANWSALPGIARMGIVGGAMVTATLVGGYLGDTLTGRAASLLGGLLFGPLLAVHGQVYQTGADAWQLFAWWAVVLLAYAVLVRFVGTWVLALIAIHIAWFTWVDQELGGSAYEGGNAWIIAALAFVDAAVVALAERWLDGREREVLVHTAAIFGLAVVLPFGIVTLVDEPPDGGWLGLLLLIAGLASIWLIYRWRRPRLGMLVAFAAVSTILITAFVGRIVFEILDAELFGVAMLGAVVCGLVWGFTRWLLSWRREHPVAHEPKPAKPTLEPRPRITLRELFARIAPQKPPGANDPRVIAALHDADATDAPLMVRVFTAIGTWIGAAMVAVIFAALEIYEIVPLAAILGAGLFAGTIVLARRSARSLALTQLIWAMALGAHGLWLGALVELDVSDTAIAATWTVLNAVLLFVIRVPSFQLASAICTVGFATWLGAELELPAYPLWVALPIAAVATLAWIVEVPWASRLGRTWSALAYGLPLGVAGPLTLLSLDDDGGAMVAQGWAAPIATLALVALIGTVLWRARQEQGSIESKTHVIGAIAVLSVLAARHVPGVSLALLWLLLAHLRKSPGLQTIALIQLAGFLFFFYYQLDTTLLRKSLWVLSTGAVLLLGAWLGRVRSQAAERAERRSRWLPAIALTLLTTGLIAGASMQKQQILAHGQTVLLPLAPVDPRSLMQGDYMVLRYTLEQEMGFDMFDIGEPNIPRHGRVVITVDDDGVGHFARLDDGRELGEHERRIEYRLREGWSGRVRIGAESFFFEEGSAQRYEDARYGELVVADDGEVVLIGLRDADRRPLGLRLH
jgi:uncharacterized membrane-anchored protein